MDLYPTNDLAMVAVDMPSCRVMVDELDRLLIANEVCEFSAARLGVEVILRHR